jgi:CDP-paratose 2-epimerase
MKVVITGGAGFIGSNSAKYFLDKKDSVVIFDNLSRKGTQKNLVWLNGQQNKPISIKGEITDEKSVAKLNPYLKSADLVLHFAAQVAVTTSVIDPKNDFNVNAWGTFIFLEALRKSESKAKVIYTSTNKVYGNMDSVKVKETDTRYEYVGRPYGIDETQNLDFHSPYGCSKGAADQYVRDYSRIYGLDTVVFRQSCIYGPRQFGVEDQGWVAWFIIATMLGKPITIYGNGKQIRDLLFIDDLVRAYEQAYSAGKKTFGQVYNIGGGYKNTMSVWSDFRPILNSLFRKEIVANKAPWRPGDQFIYISDNRKAYHDFGWKPQVNVNSGIRKLFDWVMENKTIFAA